jgi:DNA topoisomerase I
MNSIVIVESPAKAKTINKYLGEGYTVMASYGHVRDLPPKDGSVRPDEDFAMDWEVAAQSKKHLTAIVNAAKSADAIYLATDPDREGEAISWHVLEELKSRKAINGAEVKRVTFNAITKTAVLEAMANPRDLDIELVDAYLARRALDYLVGFNLSPVLWRKLPGSRSAGRVQSVALRLICSRELEIEKFHAQEYWTVAANLAKSDQQKFSARLTHLDGQKLDKFGLPDEASATAAVAAIEAAQFTVESVEKKQKQRRPYAPFTTSTLQQEASGRLYFSARQTMDIAQRLYEGADMGGETVGLITYMRTDGVQIDGSAINTVRSVIGQEFGADYLPEKPRHYATKAKNAQEAHEAIRPTDPARRPKDVAPYLSKDQLRLYDLIWKRTIASQMEAAVMDQVVVVAASADKTTKLRANGSVIRFPGFLKVYEDAPKASSDAETSGDEADDRILPPVNEGEGLTQSDIKPDQHFTQPPPRFSEASLVKTMEELGIGRPSTYASIIQVLQDRSYVRMDSRRFIPEDRGRVVTAFLESFFAKYVEYSFTADLENKLDEISGGRLNWKVVLAEFWRDFITAIEGTSELRITQVIDTLDELLEPHLFPKTEDGTDLRKCPSCADGRLSLKFGKFGGFVGCNKYPDCRYTRQLSASANDPNAAVADGPKDLGEDPETGLMVTLRAGPYGIYVQLGDAETLAARAAEEAPPQVEEEPPKGKKAKKPKKPKVPKPKRSSLPKGMDPESIDLAQALKLLSLPREVGIDPESGDMIQAGIGRFGPYLKFGDKYQSLGIDDNVLEIGLNRAVVVIAEGKEKKGRGGGAAAKSLGEHPDDGKAVTVRDGRFGPYVQHGSIRATLPRDKDKDAVTLDEAVELIAAKAAKTGTTKKAAPKKKATAKKKTAAKKTVAKKKTAVKKKPAAKTVEPDGPVNDSGEADA